MLMGGRKQGDNGEFYVVKLFNFFRGDRVRRFIFKVELFYFLGDGGGEGGEINNNCKPFERFANIFDKKRKIMYS